MLINNKYILISTRKINKRLVHLCYSRAYRMIFFFFVRHKAALENTFFNFVFFISLMGIRRVLNPEDLFPPSQKYLFQLLLKLYTIFFFLSVPFARMWQLIVVIIGFVIQYSIQLLNKQILLWGP